MAGETHEYTDMYPGMAKQARDEGFDEIADWFETLAKAGFFWLCAQHGRDLGGASPPAS